MSYSLIFTAVLLLCASTLAGAANSRLSDRDKVARCLRAGQEIEDFTNYRFQFLSPYSSNLLWESVFPQTPPEQRMLDARLRADLRDQGILERVTAVVLKTCLEHIVQEKE